MACSIEFPENINTGLSAETSRSISDCATESTGDARLLIGHGAPTAVIVSLGNEPSAGMFFGCSSKQMRKAGIESFQPMCGARPEAAILKILAGHIQRRMGNRQHVLNV
jgi:hypothetical protein